MADIQDLATFFDRQGTIYLAPQPSGRTKVGIAIVKATPETLIEFRQTFGVGTVAGYPQFPPHRYFRFFAYSANAKIVLEQIAPHLEVKKDLADLALETLREQGCFSRQNGESSFEPKALIEASKSGTYTGRQDFKPKSKVKSALKPASLSGIYNRLLESQGGVCAICKIEPELESRSLALDHDHGTGTFRGVLCNRCNSGLGLLGDNPQLLEVGAEYLRSRPHSPTRPIVEDNTPAV